MATIIRAKTVRGERRWHVMSAEGDTKHIKEYPQCKSPSQFYDALREELGLAHSSSKHDVVWALQTKTWKDDHWQNDFSIRLKALREKARLTQADLAEKAALSIQAISAYESDARSPSWEAVQRLSHALGVEEKEFKGTFPDAPNEHD